MPAHSRTSVLPEHDGSGDTPLHPYVVVGEREILAIQPILDGFSALHQQHGVTDDLSYFLEKPGFMKRTPCLFLFAGKRASLTELAAEDIHGAVLLFEYRLGGLGCKVYSSNDRSGRGTVLSSPENRLRVAGLVCQLLMERNAKLILMSFTNDSQRSDEEQSEQMEKMLIAPPRKRWTLRSRTQELYLPLAGTLDETLARMGKKTRANFRYYRRRAEAELGVTFVPLAEPSVSDLIAFNSSCMYPVKTSTLLWRVQILSKLRDPFLMGIQDREGLWLSIVAGRRFDSTSEILWQMNRSGHKNHSLGIVMRSYCMEHELAKGVARLQVEGGTAHSMHHSFEKSSVLDLIVLKYPPKYLGRIAKRFLKPDNKLGELFVDRDARWYTAPAAV